MDHDRLIDLLSANLVPVSGRRLGRTLGLAILAGAAGAVLVMLATVGPRADLQCAAHLEWTVFKLVLPLSAIGFAAPSLAHSMRPRLENRTSWLLVFFPFVAAIALGVAMLLAVRPETWIKMLLGANQISSVRCLLCIMSFATIPLAALTWALRQGAPTRLEISGALAGIVSGGVAAAAYAFNCDSDTIPFIMIWYSVAILLCAFIGTQFGPGLLRW